jgi:gamma-D-glutamyl-L-lysine dipeptidyl-peptidase
MLYKICVVPVSPIRREASHKTEMISQLVFGETCVVNGQGSGEWVRIKARYDGYVGWCQASHLVDISEKIFSGHTNELTMGWISHVKYNKEVMAVPSGSCLSAFNKGSADWNGNMVSYQGRTWKIAAAKREEPVIRALACQFMNTAYLWGGKTIFGVDCSGFTQTVFRFLGIPLLRDAWQQAGQGEPVGSLGEAICGDLAFFDNPEGKISHVGILFSGSEIIHASGKVRVDSIDGSGIILPGKTERSHQLKMVKRYF